MKIALSLAVVVIAAVTVAGIRQHRHSEASRSVEILRDWARTTKEQEEALAALKDDGEPQITKALIEILTASQTSPLTREMIIPVLAVRRDPEIPEVLSELLQPHGPLAIRRRAVDALGRLECPPTCVRRVLHYKERIWRGDVTSELDGFQQNDGTKEFQAEEAAINEDLNSVLQHNRVATMKELQSIYGLGSLHPSYFALYLSQELTLPEACADLTRPYLDKIADAQKRKAINGALAHNKCPLSPSVLD
jgi:hypothetical protein